MNQRTGLPFSLRLLLSRAPAWEEFPSPPSPFAALIRQHRPAMMVQALRRYLRRLVEGLDADGNRELELPEFEKFLTVYPDDGEIDASVAVSTF